MNIIDRVEELRYNTLTNIENIQKAKVPIIYELELERRYSFNTHGFYHSAYDETWLLYTCRNLPYSSNLKRHVFSDGLENMVNNKEIRPFMIFIDNKFVKWSDITIIKDCNFSYILIKNNKNLLTPICECILLPENITYREQSNLITDYTAFAFDNYGMYVNTPQGNVYTTIDIEDKDIFFSSSILKQGLKQLSDIDTKYKITKSNFIFFKNGFLDTSINLELHGLNVYSVNDNNLNGHQYISKQFYYTNSNTSIDNITNPLNRDNVIYRLKRETIPEYILELAKSFDFKFDKDIEFKENVSKALLYIMTYNSSLMNEIYKSTSNIVSKLYKGKDIKILMDELGYVTMSRRINGILENYPIIFHNGDLYKYYSEIKYKNKNFTFPVVDIADNDDIEIIFFKNIDNRTFPLYLPSGHNDIYILDSSINIEDYKLYTINPELQSFNIERSNRTQYEVPFTSKRLNDNKIEIILGDSYHYDRSLTLASDRQFRYMSKTVSEDCIDVILSSDFNFCSDRSKYMVFINGRKIDNENFMITLAKSTRPFDDVSIYLNIPLLKNDKIDIFYVSEQLDEVSIQPTIDTNGIIVINRDKISYDLDEELYMIFVNGKKLNHTQLKSMNSNRLKITTDLESIKNLCIIKHVKDNDILKNIFDSINSELDTSYDSISSYELSDIFLHLNNNTNIEDDIKNNKISTDQVLYHIIQDYYMRPYINSGDIIDYDFKEFDSDLEQDSDNNTLFSTMDATKEDKLEL